MKRYIITLLLALSVLNNYAQDETSDYRRSSLYSILITHPSRKFSSEIQKVFSTIPIPEKFNNHDLSVKVIASDEKKEEKEGLINAFISKNAIARRMVGKWFERDPEKGLFSMELIAARGNYDASYFDVEFAKSTARGTGQLADAGEELIGNTFLLINDIKYIDKSKGSSFFGAMIKIAGAAASIATGNSDLMDLGDDLGDMISSIKGFKVTVTSYLYRLEWNDEVAGTLYQSYYMTADNYDAKKKSAFDNDNRLFRLRYIGAQSINSGNTSFLGINEQEPEVMIRKVCTRAIDNSIVELQLAHEEFRVKTPIFQVGKTVQAKIGMKEGVTSKSKFEVMEQYVDKNGRTQYKSVGVIQAIAGKIWDNRYMAVEERAEGSNLTYTEFKKISGSDFQAGMLIREIK